MSANGFIRVHLCSSVVKKQLGEKELNMEIKRSGSQPSNKGPADWFTGTVRIGLTVSREALPRVLPAHRHV